MEISFVKVVLFGTKSYFLPGEVKIDLLKNYEIDHDFHIYRFYPAIS